MLVGIIGTGLIGSSIGLAARAAGHRSVGWDADAATARRSAGSGALDAVATSPEEAAAEADTVVVATPLEATLALLRAFPASPRAGLVLDVASVKVPVVAAARSVPHFVASHPLAGSERTGPEAASGGLFRDRTWAYVKPEEAALEARARAFIAALGGRPLAVPAARHDAVVAFTSHLPQVVASALGSMLAARLEDPLVLELCSSGMRSMTRLAGSAWSVWGGVLEANGGAVAQEVRALVGVLRSVVDALETGNDPELAALFAQAADGAARIGTNEGAARFVNPGTPNDTTTRGSP